MTTRISPTHRLYLDDDTCLEAEAVVVAAYADTLAFDRTPFYPGGGGQPADTGRVRFADGVEAAVLSARADEADVIWHACEPVPGAERIGQTARLIVDRERREALTRHHTVLHVLNTITLRDYGGWITGVQIGTDYSRIDFKLENFSPALCAELEARVNAVLAEGHRLKAYTIPEAEFRARADLLRTLEARPPVREGRVRVVEIEGFDAQACGGTHVRNTGEVGRFSIYRTDNKGKINKRLYVRLDPPGSHPAE